jgi:hypothetical protein
MLWRDHRGRGRAAVRARGHRADRLVADRAGRLTGKYLPGQPPPEGSRATDVNGGDKMIARWLRDDVLEKVQLLTPLAADAGLSLAQLAVAWVLQNPERQLRHRRRLPPGAGPRQRRRGRQEARRRPDGADRPGARGRRDDGPEQDGQPGEAALARDAQTGLDSPIGP